MKDEERQRIIEILESGEMLSSEWASVLFPNQRRECELVYDGKVREEDILAETMSVPLQQTRLFGKNGNGWQNKLIFGNNLQVMKSLLEDKKSGKLCNADGTPGIRLVYIDPPFSTKKEMKGTGGVPAYQDKLAAGEFLEFLRKRLILIRELLSDDGSVYVHLDWRMNSYVRVLMDEVFGKNNFVNEIIWKRRGGKTSPDTNRLENVVDHILWYSVSARKTLNFQFSKSDSEEYIKTQFKYVDKDGRRYRLSPLNAPAPRPTLQFEFRGYKPHPNGWSVSYEKLEKMYKENKLVFPKELSGRVNRKQYLDEWAGYSVSSLWTDIPVVAPSASERIGYPTQKPEKLLDRIIKSSSSEGDIVTDFFLGSGTTVTVAEKLGRRWIGSDCGKLAIYTTQKRMLNLRKKIGNKGAVLKPKPFALFNAGLYELEELAKESRENWRRFVLQLFQCREEPHKIGGIQMDGKLRGKSVLVYNPRDLKKGELITEETVQELHSNIGKMVGGSMFLIAPAMSFGFFQDYVDYGEVRYYALRIPYSIINELHRRDFTALHQPDNEAAINDTVEAVGFDFNRRPKLEYSVGVKKRKDDLFYSAFIKIKTFKSEARIPEALKIDGNRETLSMLMLDYDYDSVKGVFEFDEVFYADTLSKDGWTAFFSRENSGEDVMAIFVDIYGNEARELIKATDFGERKPVAKEAKENE